MKTRRKKIGEIAEVLIAAVIAVIIAVMPVFAAESGTEETMAVGTDRVTYKVETITPVSGSATTGSTTVTTVTGTAAADGTTAGTQDGDSQIEETDAESDNNSFFRRKSERNDNGFSRCR